MSQAPGRDSFSPVSVNRAPSVQLSQHDAIMQQQMFQQQQQQMQQMQRAAMEQQMLEQQMLQECVFDTLNHSTCEALLCVLQSVCVNTN